VLKPLPYRDGDRLVNLFNTAPTRGLPRAGVAMANVADWKARNHVFTDIAVYRPNANLNLTGVGEPERLIGSRVSANLFPMLDVAPLYGRLFLPGEDTDGRDRVAILTYGLWKRRFGADPGIVGHTIALNGEHYTVVGVLGESFAYPTREYQIHVVAAIREVDPEQPVYDARTLDAVIDRSLGERRLQTALLGAFASIALLLASIGVYGVIAFGVGQRTREFGIRLALGARRGEIVRGVLRRGVVLFAAGSALGLVGAAASARVLGSLLFNVSGFDASSFAAATAVLFAVALAACALPARRAAGVDPCVALRTE
jgi:hypothetical protein